MDDKKFDPRKLKKLNNPERLKDIPPVTIQSRLTVTAPRTMVEIGAGTAFFSRAFFDLFGAAELYACDLSDTMIQWMKENITPEYPGIIPVKNRESAIPIDDATADLVFTIALHHELENPLLMLKEAYRLLTPGGEMFIVDWAKREMDEGPPARIRCQPGEVAAQMAQAGFGDIHTHEDLAKHFLVVGKKPG